MTKVARSIFLIGFLTASGICNAQQGFGVWADKEDKYVYAFKKDNELLVLGEKSTWVSAGNAFNPYDGKWSRSSEKGDGVWRYGDEICWVGDKKQQKGNMMLYVDTLQCCLAVQFLGKKLVLSEVWSKGTDDLNICGNRVLERKKSFQD